MIDKWPVQNVWNHPHKKYLKIVASPMVCKLRWLGVFYFHCCTYFLHCIGHIPAVVMVLTDVPAELFKSTSEGFG